MKEKLYAKNTVGLTFASFGHCIFISLTSMALPMFLTDVMYINPATVSAIFLATRIWDGLNDPMMGVIVDKTHTRWGKCRPYLLYGAIPLLVMTVLMFTPVNFSQTGKFLYALITYMLFITAFTSIDIPLSGVKPLLFTSPENRNKAQSISSTFGSLGSLLAVDLFFAMVIIFGGENTRLGYFITVIVLAGIAFIALAAGFFTMKEVVPISKKPIPLKETFKALLQNKFLMIAIVLQITTIGISAYGILLPYFSKWNLADSFSFGSFSVESVLIPVLSTATGIIFMIAIMITPYLLKLGSKKKIFIIMAIAGGILNIISFAVGYNNLFVFMAIRMLAHIPPTVNGAITSFMIMDCLDYAEVKTGKRTEGVSFAINNLIMKSANAIFSAAILFVLGIAGYNAAITEPALAIGESISHNFGEMLNAIFIMMTVVPAVSLFIQIIPMIFYKLDEKKLKAITQELTERRKAMEEEDKIIEVTSDILSGEVNV